ncbi:hypothetical protein [Entomohabitans teleogrylli]|uniref:hypothetical protein n=1 Tax=Entomohabitans teleogrylli TaxID=1384589 RepID=UPI00073D1DCA|nr:hypothetical protein [Entomohabitans teleogrylli]
MSLLEAFYYTFGADAEPLDKALKESEKNTDRLKEKVSAADEQAAKLGTSFVSLARSAAGLLGVTVTLAGLKTLTVTTAETTAALGMQARVMGVNVSTLDAWRKAVTESGGDANAFSATLGNLSRRFRDPEAALLRLSGSLGKMSAYRAHRIGKMLGLDESTIELLRQGRVKVEELIKKQKEQGVITKAQVEQAEKFNLKLRQLKGEFENLKMQIGTALIPVFEKLLDAWNKTSNWLKDNKEAVGDFFIALAGIITAYYLPAMIRAGIATLAATWPILLIIAAFAALALVVADVIGYFNGMNSVTGRLVEAFPLLGEILETLKSVVLDCWNALVLLVTDPVQFLKLLKDEFREFLDMLFGEGAGDTIFTWIEKGADGVAEVWRELEKIIGRVVDLALKGFQSIGRAWAKVKGWFGAGKDEVEQAKREAAEPDVQIEGWEDEDYLNRKRREREAKNGEWQQSDLTYGGQSYWRQLANNPVNSLTSNSISNSSRNDKREFKFNIENMEVNTQATDAQGIAGDLVGGVLEDTVNHYANGLMG